MVFSLGRSHSLLVYTWCCLLFLPLRWNPLQCGFGLHHFNKRAFTGLTATSDKQVHDLCSCLILFFLFLSVAFKTADLPPRPILLPWFWACCVFRAFLWPVARHSLYLVFSALPAAAIIQTVVSISSSTVPLNIYTESTLF